MKNRPPQLVEAREFAGGRGKGVGHGCPGYGAEDAIDKRVWNVFGRALARPKR
ncbi:MAG: hypothetical protein NZ847_04295 [Acidobacteria bacterium]|nr:hypothetical protein [Acidobacteriota bacterium]